MINNRETRGTFFPGGNLRMSVESSLKEGRRRSGTEDLLSLAIEVSAHFRDSVAGNDRPRSGPSKVLISSQYVALHEKSVGKPQFVDQRITLCLAVQQRKREQL